MSMNVDAHCPSCGAAITDLWDHDWTTSECIQTECSGCEAELIITRDVSVRYSVDVFCTARRGVT